MSKVAQPNFNETRVSLGAWLYKNPLFRMYRVGETKFSLYVGRQDNVCLIIMKNGALPVSRYTAASMLWLNRRDSRREV
jgi:hypothetical protein